MNRGAERGAADHRHAGPTFLSRLQGVPPLLEEGLWPPQITAINNLEQSLRENRPRALIQMATGSGKTFPEEDEETSVQGLESVFKEQPPIEYNPAIPIETFDIIVTDECHRSGASRWPTPSPNGAWA